MTYLDGKVVLQRGKHSLLDPLNHFLVLTASISIAANHFTKGQVIFDEGDYIAIECKQFPLEVHLPLSGPVQAALNEKRPDKIHVYFKRTSVSPKSYHLNTSGFSEILRHTIAPIFVDFFENAKHSLERQFGNSPEHWPPIWDFARVVRNACSHGGHLHMAGSKPRPVSWHHLNYYQALNGREIVGYDLSVGDMLVLLFELGDELDRTAHLG